jgi:hypothetical protein
MNHCKNLIGGTSFGITEPYRISYSRKQKETERETNRQKYAGGKRQYSRPKESSTAHLRPYQCD